jgi:beta-N-acetylhexosaminidase
VLRLTPRLALAIGLIVAASAGAIAIASTGPSHHTVHARVAQEPPMPRRSAIPTPGLAAVVHTTLLQRLTPTQLAGQRIIYSYGGLSPPASLLRLIRRGDAAGVIFFTPNIASRSQLRTVVQELQRANASSPVHAPLLMMTDQEGGQVRRLAGAPEQSEKQLGESKNAFSDTRQAGAAAGGNLSGAGLNVNLAPVLDVARHPGNFIDQYERSYGSDPLLVGELGRSFIETQQLAGVAATAKHFPGLGAATRDDNTDERAVALNVPLHDLRAVDEAPYGQAIAAGVRLVMLSWAVYPALDARLPAGFSPTIIQQELRQRMGFRGVTITDSLEAGALDSFGGPGQRGVLAAAAGADLVLCSARTVYANTPTIGVRALHGIASAIGSSQISRASAEQAASRVIALRGHV